MEKQKAEIGKAYRAALLPELRSVDEKARTIEFVASTEAVDRYGDVIRVAGWQLANYLKNPVFLWAHKAGEPPIGRTVALRTEMNPPALVQTVQFADAATYPFADTVFNLYKNGFMRAVSVGFMPLEQPKAISDLEGNLVGWEFNAQELLELSAVPIPANADCLARAAGDGFSRSEIARAFSDDKENEVNIEESELQITGRQEEPTEPLEDEPAGSVAEYAEELSEELDEIASGVAEAQQLCAVIISQLEPNASEEEDAAKPAVEKHKHAADDGNLSNVLARVVETRARLDSLAGTVARPAPKRPESGQKSAEITTLDQLDAALKAELQCE